MEKEEKRIEGELKVRRLIRKNADMKRCGAASISDKRYCFHPIGFGFGILSNFTR